MKEMFCSWVVAALLCTGATFAAATAEEATVPSTLSREAFLFASAHAHFRRGNYYDASEILLKGMEAYPQWYRHDLEIVHLFGHRRSYAETRLNLEYLVPRESTNIEAQKLRFLLAYIYFQSQDRAEIGRWIDHVAWEPPFRPHIEHMRTRLKEPYREQSWRIGEAYQPPTQEEIGLKLAKFEGPNDPGVKLIINRYHQERQELHRKPKKSRYGDREIAPITRKCFYSDSEYEDVHLSKDCLPYLMESYGRPSLNRVNYPSKSLPSDPRLIRTVQEEVDWLHRNLTNGRFRPKILFLDQYKTPSRKFD